MSSYISLAGWEAVNNIISSKQRVVEPTVILIKDESEKPLQFLVVVEKEILFMIKTGGKSFMSLLMALFATYYTFWLSLPKGTLRHSLLSPRSYF
jgi:hypothetical protein